MGSQPILWSGESTMTTHDLLASILEVAKRMNTESKPISEIKLSPEDYRRLLEICVRDESSPNEVARRLTGIRVRKNSLLPEGFAALQSGKNISIMNLATGDIVVVQEIQNAEPNWIGSEVSQKST